MRRPTLVITGAGGFIGSRIAAHFASHDWNVIALVRSMPVLHFPKQTKIPGWEIFPVKYEPVPGVLYFHHDLRSPQLPVLPDDIDAFIHAGYIVQEADNDAFRQNKEAAERLLNALEGKNVSQKIFLSSLSADHNALSVYGRQKAAIEELFLQHEGTIIRAGLVLGNGGLFGAMKTYLSQKTLIPLFGDGEQPIQTVFVDDLVDAIEKMISKSLKGKFVVATDEPVPYNQFYKALATHLGVKPRFLKIPFWMATLAIRTGKLFRKNLPVNEDNLLGLKQMKRIPSADDLKKIGIELRNYEESFAILTAETRKRSV